MSASDPIAFVLSGGASLGAVQVGMLRALYERGVAPDLIVGTSAGAINGAFIASRPPTGETVDELGEIWRSVSRGQVFPLRPLVGLLGFLGARDHLVPQSGLRRLITAHLEHARLEQMPIPFPWAPSMWSPARSCCSPADRPWRACWPAQRSRRCCRRWPGRTAA